VVEDGSLEALELIVRLEPELLVQQPPPRAVDLERVRLATAAIEGQHQLAAEALA
jgi:acyl carrier protein